MRIAYISYEYPPDIGSGGIATYIYQVSRLMKDRGHDVEIFCGSYNRTISKNYNEVLTHRIQITNVNDFRTKVVVKFMERHQFLPFDVFESPEINGNGYEIKKTFPDLPMVVKIHMPVVLQMRLFHYYTTFFHKFKFTLSNLLKKGKIDLGQWSKHDKNQYNDIDYLITSKADLITTPSQAMKDWAVKFWRIPDLKIKVIPLPYIPEKEYLSIPIQSDSRRILFIGKLNVHKGLVNLIKAIPIVLAKYPETKFRFVAPDGPSHKKGISMKEYMLTTLKDYSANLELIGSVPLTDIPKHLELSDFCIFPSIWECFGLVVCESMAAGRVPIFSEKGGMKEIAEHNSTGIMINPHKPKQMARAMISLLENKEKRYVLAENARKSIHKKYNAEEIGIMNEETYFSITK